MSLTFFGDGGDVCNCGRSPAALEVADDSELGWSSSRRTEKENPGQMEDREENSRERKKYSYKCCQVAGNFED
ncbi:Hypothetical protein NTJ_14488 [Nesidiocoris tenuis]|uniref:Uncharacterized protein n=1 Tax=Nesidiocoris tenuis TaxID=355587 RepID=A0ABN7BEW6_9HEMI|nr:Hypothetical protein NTJ_14488 [Nesidiocoris tenuis]